MSFIFIFILFTIIQEIKSKNNTELCLQSDEDCPVCPKGKEESFTSLWMMETHVKFIYNARKAEKLIKSIDSKNVISTQSLLGLHISLNYFCCHSKQEKQKILKLLENYQWQNVGPFSFNKYHCNVDHKGNYN